MFHSVILHFLSNAKLAKFWFSDPFSMSNAKSAELDPNFCDRLVGPVVKASASRAEGPGFESRLRRDFFGVESYQ